MFLLSTLSSRKEVYQFELFYFFSYFGCGKCSWLLHMQMVRPEPKRQLTKKKPQRLVLFGALFSATCVLNFLVLLYYTNPAIMSSVVKTLKYTALLIKLSRVRFRLWALSTYPWRMGAFLFYCKIYFIVKKPKV